MKILSHKTPIEYSNLQKRPILPAFVIILFILSVLSILSVPATATSDIKSLEGFPRNNMVPDGPIAMDATVEMLGEKEIALRTYAAQVGSEMATMASPFGQGATIGDELSISVTDIGMGYNYDEMFVVTMEGTNGIILVEKAAYDNYDPATNEYIFPNPSGSVRTGDRISTTQLEYLVDEFDNNIYPTVTSVFGEPLPRGDEGLKTWILIHNIRDESYYDDTQTTYIAGYFSASEDAINNKNMMHIDSLDWENRTGSDSKVPYLYESVFAHEFQHLVHFDQDPDEEAWIDEGMADLAGFLCDYGHPSGHIAYYLAYHPITSLTFWGRELEDYGASYLFQLYLYENYGGADFISNLVQEQANGIEGVETTLDAFSHTDSFDDIFHFWTIANYLDDNRKAGGKYGYDTLQIGTMDTWGYSIEYALSNIWRVPQDTPPLNVPSFFGIEPQPYTAHYFRFTNQNKNLVSIDGEDFVGTSAFSGTYEWYSDAEAWAWNNFHQTFAIPESGATLTFKTNYEIEEEWDYGYVEVYDHDTGEWYTLDASGTVDYVSHPQDNPQVPPGREPMDYEAAGRWHAFTSSSNGWRPVSMDLSPFAGHTIDVYFSTWQDGAFTLQMMYVDDISIPEIGFFDDVESGEDGWTAEGWHITDGILENGFAVTTIDTKRVPTGRYPEPSGTNSMPLLGIRQMTIDPVTQSGSMITPSTPSQSERIQVSIVSNYASHILSSGYLFSVE